MSNPDRILSSCTVRINGIKGDAITSIGTGFLYAFPVPVEPGQAPRGSVIALMTNKHVLDGCDLAEFVVSAAPKGADDGPAGAKVGRVFKTFRVAAVPPQRMDHPAPGIDLCGVNISWVFEALQAEGLELQHNILGEWIQLTPAARLFTRAVESIVMVGYPRGLWDSANNSPLIRRGITATHPLVEYEGKKEFVIDAACFPGSSGSPVFLFEDGMYRSNATSYSPGSRVALLGVLYAGPQFTAEGRLEARPIPHNFAPTPVTQVPMNLGFVIHADQINIVGEQLLSRI